MHAAFPSAAFNAPPGASAFLAAADSFLRTHKTTAQRSNAVLDLLSGPTGPMLRKLAADWIVGQAVPAARLVPKRYEQWLPVVSDAMSYVVLNLSADRLAPKIVEQLELPPRTRVETRLLLLISRVPGLQKLGQVLARNRHLGPALRRSLIKLENGIRDVGPGDTQKFIRAQLGPKLDQFDVRINPGLFSEASVSAIVRFTWKDNSSVQRRRGVFKVLKPYIPGYFREDLQLLHGLTEHFGTKLDQYGFATDALADTFGKVRRLLQHEVDFQGEQKSLALAEKMYRATPNVRVPRVLKELCTASITAITEEAGKKITDCSKFLKRGERLALSRQVLEAFVIVPLFSPDEHSLFHADPHAGNILYDREKKDIVILDWALTEHLSRTQRRNLALLLLYFGLRDPIAVTQSVLALAMPGRKRNRSLVFDLVSKYIDEMKVTRVPSATDAMGLIEWLTAKGLRFPSALIMLSKVLFTLDGVLHDIGAEGLSVGNVVSRHLLSGLLRNRTIPIRPLRSKDLLYLQSSALLYPARIWIGAQKAALEWLTSRNAKSVG